MRFVQAMLERAGVRVMLNELSSTVVFERPTEEAFVRKWQLACQVRSCGARSGTLHWWQLCKVLCIRILHKTGLPMGTPEVNQAGLHVQGMPAWCSNTFPELLQQCRQCKLHTADEHSLQLHSSVMLTTLPFTNNEAG